MIHVKVTQEDYVPKESNIKNPEYQFKYIIEVTSDAAVQFVEMEMKHRYGEVEKEVYFDHVNGDNPVVNKENPLNIIKFIRSENKYCNVRGVLTFVDLSGKIEEVDVPLTFFKVE